MVQGDIVSIPQTLRLITKVREFLDRGELESAVEILLRLDEDLRASDDWMKHALLVVVRDMQQYSVEFAIGALHELRKENSIAEKCWLV